MIDLASLTRDVARLIGNAEEVAFYGGAEMEREFLEKGFNDLKTLMEGIYSVRNSSSLFVETYLHHVGITDEDPLQHARRLRLKIWLV